MSFQVWLEVGEGLEIFSNWGGAITTSSKTWIKEQLPLLLSQWNNTKIWLMTFYAKNFSECIFIFICIICLVLSLPLSPSLDGTIILFAILTCSRLVLQWFVEISAKELMRAEQVMSLVPNIVLCVKFIYTSKELFVCVVEES